MRTPFRTGLVIPFLLWGTVELPAQWELPVPLNLTGANPNDRQVNGLTTPAASSDAVSLNAARELVYARTTVTGNTALLGQLTPSLAAYIPGMLVTIIPTLANAAAPTLDLNGLGPHFIVKPGNIPLLAGDLRPGIPVRVAFNGTYSVLASATHIPCPTGYSSPHHALCIQAEPQAAATFYSAASICVEQGARLCTISEWSHACHMLSGFFATVSEAEWVDHAANYNSGAKLVGVGIDGGEAVGSGCNFGGQNTPTTPARFRCCIDR